MLFFAELDCTAEELTLQGWVRQGFGPFGLSWNKLG